MWKRGVGFRVGTTRDVHRQAATKPTLGLRLRSFMEYADAAWVISTHEHEADARQAETLISLRYGLRQLPFMARHETARRRSRSLADQERIDEIFEAIDTEAAGRRLLADEGLSFDHPHHHRPGTLPRTAPEPDLTLCGERRGSTPMHRVAMVGRDEEGKRALERPDLSVRPAKSTSGLLALRDLLARTSEKRCASRAE